ncbi:MAG: D-alanine--D-alanine ligase [Desulfatitalea sp.]|nr:D-alanine--D-alanine ligase [Desulfatitalea sp.]
MRIAVVHNALSRDSAPDEQDVQIQAEAVRAALDNLDHDTLMLTCDLDLKRAQAHLKAAAPDRVFNLVESLAGTGRMIHLFPTLLDAMAQSYTGASAEALLLTSNKVLAKAWLAAAGVPTPAWIGPSDTRRPRTLPPAEPPPARWIVKSVWEHASIGIDAEALVDGHLTGVLVTQLGQRASRLGGACFAEAFIEGREFNLSILDGSQGPQVLPPAEILFEAFADGQPHIVDYRAKWDPDSHQYHHTPRRFAFGPEDRTLLARLEALALRCWELFDLRGYARVDFRVDSAGCPWVLEVNANPCLAPDAGFAAALTQAGIGFDQAIDRIATC